MGACALDAPVQFFKCNLLSATCDRQNLRDKRRLRKSLVVVSNSLISQRVHPLLRRRLLLDLVSFSAATFLFSSPSFAVPLPEMKEPEVLRSRKLPSGVRIQDIVDGEGAEAHDRDFVEFNYVCRRANGYFVHSTVDQFSGESRPVILPLNEKQDLQGSPSRLPEPCFRLINTCISGNTGSEQGAYSYHATLNSWKISVKFYIIKGLKEVLLGMKVGGKRRALIPPEVGYVNENLKPIPDEFGPRRSLLSHANEPLIFEVQLLRIL